MLCDRDKKKLQRKLEDLHCDQCDICLCGGCCDTATSICDCCVDPMEDLLNQLKNILAPNATIQVTLDTGATQSFQVNQIVSIGDSIINIQNTSFISICNISRVRWANISTINQINLLPPVCTCEECDCCERPLRENLNKFINANVELQFKGQQNPNTFQGLTIRKVGLGIVIGQNIVDGAPDAYSICKITRFNVMS
ncbi:hypothetical protein WBZ18_14470 [Clostridium botulinum]|uniref:hypothetical protein n=1 Tax=Clostridium botulinum TaxID=1491 RepID=UPI0004675A71|nr:hypothetical protein [Clostridium botulinum]AJD25917.1 hypothetical protein T257_2291 [Clostridium botulinum CDC_297]APR00289.1 hypothetical protein RSJ2_3041 [Clostridium botulinum]MBY6758569.1 hypothetical protein [Clostridium botulinum]MBY6877887.1 hypothetical protein [Clostridium botulinum]MBY6892861.1 hypothetical protein [Clostridium botulinum]